MTLPNDLTISPIGFVESPFKEKFGLPRQAGLIKSASAKIHFHAPYDTPDAFRGIEQFSHLWLTCSFHQHQSQDWKATVRPPRLGGNTKVGVFASRAPFRPNSLGLSVVKLRSLELKANKVALIIDCPDLLDGTPIFDIKPYIRYSDTVPEARSGFAEDKPSASYEVYFSKHSEQALNHLDITSKKNYTVQSLRKLITEVLSYDPRPAYKSSSDGKTYRMRLYDLDIAWKVESDQVLVLDILNVDH